LLGVFFGVIEFLDALSRNFPFIFFCSMVTAEQIFTPQVQVQEQMQSD
jgi:hypothetical protein